MDTNHEQNDSNIDFGKMGNWFQLAQLFSQTMAGSKNNNTSVIAQPDIDTAINSQEMNILKAAIPYLDYRMQKQMAIIIKLMELQKTFELYKDPDSFVEVSALNKGDRNKSEMLNSIKHYCSDKNKNMIDIIQTMMNLNALIKNHQSFNQNVLPNPDIQEAQDPLQEGMNNPADTEYESSAQTPNEPHNNTSNTMSNFMNMFNMFKSMNAKPNTSNPNTNAKPSQEPTPSNSAAGYTNPVNKNPNDMMAMLNMFMSMNQNQGKDEPNAKQPNV